MQPRTFDDLATYLRQRRELAETRPVLLLGAGASYAAGVGLMSELFKFTGVANFDEFSNHIEKYTAEERYVRLAEFLQTRAPAEITPGYRALAAVLEEDYFDLVLSTNMDPLLEDALADARL
jgi:hypothetical protein